MYTFIRLIYDNTEFDVNNHEVTIYSSMEHLENV